MTQASRRSFLRLVLTGGAAVMSGTATPILRPARAAAPAPASRRRRRVAAVTPPPALRKEIANQKQLLARTLETIRGYRLPPGSSMAFVFRPLPRARKGRSAR